MFCLMSSLAAILVKQLQTSCTLNPGLSLRVVSLSPNQVHNLQIWFHSKCWINSFVDMGDWCRSYWWARECQGWSEDLSLHLPNRALQQIPKSKWNQSTVSNQWGKAHLPILVCVTEKEPCCMRHVLSDVDPSPKQQKEATKTLEPTWSCCCREKPFQSNKKRVPFGIC